MTSPKPVNGVRRRPSRDILSGESADVYFSRAEEILSKENIDPVVVMEVFARREAVLCGIDEAKVLIAHVLGDAAARGEATIETLADGDLIAPKEVVMRIRARYRAFGLYETALLGMMAQSTGWATAARECVEAAAPEEVQGRSQPEKDRPSCPRTKTASGHDDENCGRLDPHPSGDHPLAP